MDCNQLGDKVILKYFIDRPARQLGTQLLKQPGARHLHLLRTAWLEAAGRMMDGLLAHPSPDE